MTNEHRKAIKAREVEKMLRAAIAKNRVEFGRTINRLKKKVAARDEQLTRWVDAVAKMREENRPLFPPTTSEIVLNQRRVVRDALDELVRLAREATERKENHGHEDADN